MIEGSGVDGGRSQGLAAMARCLYCGHAGPWWDCVCVWSGEVRAGVRPKPKVRVIGGKTIIEVDAETAARNPLGFARYPGKAAPVDVSARPDDESAAQASTESDEDRRRRLKTERQQRWREGKRDGG